MKMAFLICYAYAVEQKKRFDAKNFLLADPEGWRHAEAGLNLNLGIQSLALHVSF